MLLGFYSQGSQAEPPPSHTALEWYGEGSPLDS